MTTIAQRLLNEQICRACEIDEPGLWDAETLERIEEEADWMENRDSLDAAAKVNQAAMN